jgi:hypothetical protein
LFEGVFIIFEQTLIIQKLDLKTNMVIVYFIIFTTPGAYKIKFTQKKHDISLFYCHDFQVVGYEPGYQTGFSPKPLSFGLKPR